MERCILAPHTPQAPPFLSQTSPITNSENVTTDLRHPLCPLIFCFLLFSLVGLVVGFVGVALTGGWWLRRRVPASPIVAYACVLLLLQSSP